MRLELCGTKLPVLKALPLSHRPFMRASGTDIPPKTSTKESTSIPRSTMPAMTAQMSWPVLRRAAVRASRRLRALLRAE